MGQYLISPVDRRYSWAQKYSYLYIFHDFSLCGGQSPMKMFLIQANTHVKSQVDSKHPNLPQFFKIKIKTENYRFKSIPTFS